MITYVPRRRRPHLDPGATVATGTGCLFGTALFGVAAVDAVSGTASAFVTSGIVTIARPARWPSRWATSSTGTAQQGGQQDHQRQRAVGIAVEAAANPSSTVKMRLGVNSLAGT